MKSVGLQNRYQSVRDPRGGFSLLEVLIALAVFGSGMAAILHCLKVAEKACARAQFTTFAMLRSKSIHNLLVSGALRKNCGNSEQFEDNPLWTWQVEEVVTEVPGIVKRTVTVYFATGGGTQSFSLCRLVPANDESSSLSRWVSQPLGPSSRGAP